jgi:hypothetical protein
MACGRTGDAPPWIFQTGLTFTDLLKPLMTLPGAR